MMDEMTRAAWHVRHALLPLDKRPPAPTRQDIFEPTKYQETDLFEVGFLF